MSRNLKQLVRPPKDRSLTIGCLFGLRFAAICWTLVGHSFYIIQSFLDNVDEFRAHLVNNFWLQVFLLLFAFRIFVSYIGNFCVHKRFFAVYNKFYA